MMIRSIKYCFLIVLTSLLVVSCKKDKPSKCLKSIGKITTEERELGPFTVIELKDKINLFITQDTFHRVTVEAGEHLIPYIVTKVEDGRLTIRDDNKCAWLRSYKHEINVYLTMADLDWLLYDGSGNVTTMDTIKGDQVIFEVLSGIGTLDLLLDVNTSSLKAHTGPADFKCAGKAKKCLLYCANTYGTFDCSNLLTDEVFASHSGTGDFYINVDSTLTAVINYQGNIYYSGDPPTINEEISGEGKLIRQ